VIIHQLLRVALNVLEKEVYSQEAANCLSCLKDLVPEYQKMQDNNPLQTYTYNTVLSLFQGLFQRKQNSQFAAMETLVLSILL